MKRHTVQLTEASGSTNACAWIRWHICLWKLNTESRHELQEGKNGTGIFSVIKNVLKIILLGCLPQSEESLTKGTKIIGIGIGLHLCKFYDSIINIVLELFHSKCNPNNIFFAENLKSALPAIKNKHGDSPLLCRGLPLRGFAKHHFERCSCINTTKTKENQKHFLLANILFMY